MVDEIMHRQSPEPSVVVLAGNTVDVRVQSVVANGEVVANHVCIAPLDPAHLWWHRA